MFGRYGWTFPKIFGIRRIVHLRGSQLSYIRCHVDQMTVRPECGSGPPKHWRSVKHLRASDSWTSA
jgi:hypothetical protein